jgi:hypothetical protein
LEQFEFQIFDFQLCFLSKKPQKHKSESFAGYELKLKIKYFEIELFHVIAIVLPIPETDGCYVLYNKWKG